MRYDTLSAIAGLCYIVGWLVLVSGIGLFVFSLFNMRAPLDGAELAISGITSVAISLLGSLPWFAACEVLRLAINVANDVRRMREAVERQANSQVFPPPGSPA